MVNINYLYNPNAAKKYFEKNYFIDKKLGFSVIENGTILPHKSVIIPGKYHFGLGGIVDSAGNFINDSSVHYGTGGVYTPPPSEHSTHFGCCNLPWNGFSCMGSRSDGQHSPRVVS